MAWQVTVNSKLRVAEGARIAEIDNPVIAALVTPKKVP